MTERKFDAAGSTIAATLVAGKLFRHWKLSDDVDGSIARARMMGDRLSLTADEAAAILAVVDVLRAGEP